MEPDSAEVVVLIGGPIRVVISLDYYLELLS